MLARLELENAWARSGSIFHGSILARLEMSSKKFGSKLARLERSLARKGSSSKNFGSLTSLVYSNPTKLEFRSFFHTPKSTICGELLYYFSIQNLAFKNIYKRD